MPSQFSRSHQTLRGDRWSLRSIASFALALGAMTAWTLWAFTARVSVYAVSAEARLEVDRAPLRVSAPVDGIVVTAPLHAGGSVRAGDVLVALDLRREHLQEAEAQARVAGVGPQVDRIDAELAEHERSRTQQQAALTAAQQEASARQEASRAASELADREAARARALVADGLMSAAEADRLEADARQKRAAGEALARGAERLVGERAQHDAAARARIEELARTRAELVAERSTATAAASRLQHEQRLRQLVAPVDGRIAESAQVSVGSMLRAGDAVATIVPDGTLQVVASFTPSDAFARVRAGQPARVRLDGFPHTQFGDIAAVVSRVAEEVRDGAVRVELRLTATDVALPLQHGVPASVEVTVETVSPAALALRALGRRMATPVVRALR